MNSEDQFWNLHYQSLKVQELRGEVRGVWDDEAAREITIRYLDSHAVEDKKMQMSLQRQIEAIGNSTDKIRLAKESGFRVEERAIQVQEHLDHTHQDLQNCHSHYNQFANYNSIASERIPEVGKFIQQANQAGK